MAYLPNKAAVYKYNLEKRMSKSMEITPQEYGLVDYKYNEGDNIAQLQAYVDATYGEHYSVNKFQATEFIIDGGHGEGFCIGNIMKYAQRYGKKDGYNRKDLMKVLHYALIALHVHDMEHEDG
tara:strand:+ start:406 stop:774 length:369 start_codon:yes stop_codon:yes gene_type:complete